MDQLPGGLVEQQARGVRLEGRDRRGRAVVVHGPHERAHGRDAPLVGEGVHAQVDELAFDGGSAGGEERRVVTGRVAGPGLDRRRAGVGRRGLAEGDGRRRAETAAGEGGVLRDQVTDEPRVVGGGRVGADVRRGRGREADGLGGPQ